MDLRDQLDNLDSALLSGVTTEFPNPLAANELALSHGYLVLAHAVLEEHLEKAFEIHFDRLTSWLIADMVPLETALFVYAVGDWLPEKLKTGYKARQLDRLIASGARKEFLVHLKRNNWLKSSNVESLAKLVGLNWSRFEDALIVELSDLDNLGSKRGAAGHLSPYTEQATDLTANDYPDDIRAWVDSGRRAVEAIESYLKEIVQSQRPHSLVSDWDGN